MNNEPMTVRDLINFLQQNCDDDDLVFVDDEGCSVNLYQNEIVIDKYGVNL